MYNIQANNNLGTTGNATSGYCDTEMNCIADSIAQYKESMFWNIIYSYRKYNNESSTIRNDICKEMKIMQMDVLEALQDISAMHGGEKDDFHGWLHDIKKMSQDDYYKLDEKTQHRLYKEYQLDSIYKEEDREKKWKPRGLFDEITDGLQYEVQYEMDKEILNKLKNKIPSKKK